MITSVKEFWKKHRLAHPLTILRRTVAFPFVFAGIVLTTIFIAVGWGFEEAKYFFEDSV